jgi:hypothetical protein
MHSHEKGLVQELLGLGCAYEGANPGYLCIVVPPDSDFAAVCTNAPVPANNAAVEGSSLSLSTSANSAGVPARAIPTPLRRLGLGYETIRGQGRRSAVHAKSFHT